VSDTRIYPEAATRRYLQVVRVGSGYALWLYGVCDSVREVVMWDELRRRTANAKGGSGLAVRDAHIVLSDDQLDQLREWMEE